MVLQVSSDDFMPFAFAIQEINGNHTMLVLTSACYEGKDAGTARQCKTHRFAQPRKSLLFPRETG